MDDLLQALQAQLQGIPQPQSTPADVFRMQQEALMSANRAGRMRTPVSGAGPLGAVVNYMGRKRGNEAEQAALDQLVKAMEAQSGIDSYQKQYDAIQAQIQSAMEEARKYDYRRFETDEDIRKTNATRQPEKDPDIIRSLRAAGIDPQSPEGQRIIRERFGPQRVTQVPSAPSGYYYKDPENPASGLERIPGGPAAIEAEESAKAQAAGQSRKQYAAQNVLDTIDRLKENTSGLTAGWGGLLADVPATAAKSYRNDLNTVMSNLAFDRLQQMRNESKTGGALGQVSNIELDLLKSTVAGLEQTQDPQDLIERLDIVAGHYKRFTDALNGDIPEGYETKEISGRGRFIKVQGEWYPL